MNINGQLKLSLSYIQFYHAITYPSLCKSLVTILKSTRIKPPSEDVTLVTPRPSPLATTRMSTYSGRRPINHPVNC